jgi:hypothetical protein
MLLFAESFPIWRIAMTPSVVARTIAMTTMLTVMTNILVRNECTAWVSFEKTARNYRGK